VGRGVDVITLDTSGIVALFIRKDQRHREAVRALGAARVPTRVSAAGWRRRPASPSSRASRRARPCSIAGIWTCPGSRP
jgi:hypothetical protein